MAAMAIAKPPIEPTRRPGKPTPKATDSPFSICTRNTASDKVRGKLAMEQRITRFTLAPQPLKFAGMSDDVTSLIVRVEGFVQGIGFRDFLTMAAQQNKLDGWV